jgi:hypothetical protein
MPYVSGSIHGFHVLLLISGITKTVSYLFVGLEHGVPERHVMDKSLYLALHAPVPAP